MLSQGGANCRQRDRAEAFISDILPHCVFGLSEAVSHNATWFPLDTLPKATLGVPCSCMSLWPEQQGSPSVSSKEESILPTHLCFLK